MWFGYWYDLDSDGMDDRLQRIIAGERTSVSTTSITGEDGRPTVAIVVDYSWHPGQSDIGAIRTVLYGHGWQDEGSWFDPLHILDSIVIDHVPVSSLIEIWLLDGVVMIESEGKEISEDLMYEAIVKSQEINNEIIDNVKAFVTKN